MGYGKSLDEIKRHSSVEVLTQEEREKREAKEAKAVAEAQEAPAEEQVSTVPTEPTEPEEPKTRTPKGRQRPAGDAKKKGAKVHRSAKTGKIVTAQEAKDNPDTTVTEAK